MEAIRCPSTDEWIKKLWYIYTMEHYSAIKKTQTDGKAGTSTAVQGVRVAG